MARKIKRYNEGELVGEAVGDSNEGMKEARDEDDDSSAREIDRSTGRSRRLQNMIASGSDVIGRPQDEGYRPYVSDEDREKAEGGDARVAERAGQFGDAGTSRILKATPKPATKLERFDAPKAEVRDTGSDVVRMANRAKSVAETSNKTKSSRVPTSEQAAANRNAVMDKVKGVGASVSNYFKNFKTPARRKMEEQKASKGYASGGSVSSASKRADGIATKGKTRGRMC